jgi:hypothetical protein
LEEMLRILSIILWGVKLKEVVEKGSQKKLLEEN